MVVLDGFGVRLRPQVGGGKGGPDWHRGVGGLRGWKEDLRRQVQRSGTGGQRARCPCSRPLTWCAAWKGRPAVRSARCCRWTGRPQSLAQCWTPLSGVGQQGEGRVPCRDPAAHGPAWQGPQWTRERLGIVHSSSLAIPPTALTRSSRTSAVVLASPQALPFRSTP